MSFRFLAATISLSLVNGSIGFAETLPPLKGGVAPQTFDELWTGYDPRAEPLEIETLKAGSRGGEASRKVGSFLAARPSA